MRRHSFPTVVPVLHAAPLIHRPRQAREDRTTLARISTDCAVGRGFEDELRMVHRRETNDDESYFERDGALWAQVRLRSPAIATTPMSPSHFLDLLRNEAAKDDQYNIAFRRNFARTPIAAWDMLTGVPAAFVAKRSQGEALPPRGPGLVVADMRDRCASDMASFLGNDILVTEESVYLRFDPLVRASRKTPRDPMRFRVHTGRSFDLELMESAPLPASERNRGPGSDGADAGQATLAECAVSLEDAGWLDRHGDADLRILANTLPAWILGSRGIYKGEDNNQSGIPTGFLAGLRADAFRGATGSITAEEARETIPRLVDALRPHVAFLGEPRQRNWQPSKASYAEALLAHLDASVLPRVLGVPENDAEALSALAPTP